MKDKTKKTKVVLIVAILLIVCVAVIGGIITFTTPSLQTDAYIENRLDAIDGDNKPTATIVLVTPEKEFEVGGFYIDNPKEYWRASADSFLKTEKELADFKEKYEEILPSGYFNYFEPNEITVYLDSEKGDIPINLGSSDKINYFQEKEKYWNLKKGEIIELHLNVESNAKYEGELKFAYNLEGNKKNDSDNEKEIKTFKIADKLDLNFKAPKDGQYSFSLTNTASREIKIEEVIIRKRT
ncbi:MAG: hypothetical protein RR361_03715 [Anaerovorax sp.]